MGMMIYVMGVFGFMPRMGELRPDGPKWVRFLAGFAWPLFLGAMMAEKADKLIAKEHRV